MNTVVNAFHLRAMGLMAELASALNQTNDAADFSARERAARAVFQEKLFDKERGLPRRRRNRPLLAAREFISVGIWNCAAGVEAACGKMGG